MSVEAKAAYWPETDDELEDKRILPTKPRILQLRHRVGDYDVTRLILDSTEESEASGL